jgi:hypothetical protein
MKHSTRTPSRRPAAPATTVLPGRHPADPLPNERITLNQEQQGRPTEITAAGDGTASPGGNILAPLLAFACRPIEPMPEKPAKLEPLYGIEP